LDKSFLYLLVYEYREIYEQEAALLTQLEGYFAFPPGTDPKCCNNIIVVGQL
jgi:hypothetical protein